MSNSPTVSSTQARFPKQPKQDSQCRYHITERGNAYLGNVCSKGGSAAFRFRTRHYDFDLIWLEQKEWGREAYSESQDAASTIPDEVPLSTDLLALPRPAALCAILPITVTSPDLFLRLTLQLVSLRLQLQPRDSLAIHFFLMESLDSASHCLLRLGL
jgi:hypothetical protein